MSYLLYKNNEFGTATKTSVSSTQTISDSVVDINGSTISYTPEIGASHVIYEFIFQLSYLPDNESTIHLELFEDQGSGYSGLGDNFVCIVSGNRQMSVVCNPKFILPSYTGQRSYKLRCRALSTSTEVTLHNDINSNFFHTVVGMYSIV
jgi:hypothetical protein